MSDEIYSLVAALSVLVSAVALWSAIRRRQLMRRILRSLNKEQLRSVGLEAPEDVRAEDLKKE
ncbi:MAG TPA: hypothetical protein VEK57_25900 [Thermoanaerobaculia bacterium]|nr:hypothetical protein [Thermoanaerobaculia bacterium]